MCSIKALVRVHNSDFAYAYTTVCNRPISFCISYFVFIFVNCGGKSNGKSFRGEISGDRFVGRDGSTARNLMDRTVSITANVTDKFPGSGKPRSLIDLWSHSKVSTGRMTCDQNRLCTPPSGQQQQLNTRFYILKHSSKHS